MSTARPALAATARTITGKKVASIRREGKLPGVVYGHGVDSRNVSLDAHDFELLRRKIGQNALIDLSIDGKKSAPVLIHSIGVDPVSRKPLHVDLFQVRMSEELTVDVPVVFTGESVAASKHGGTLTHAMETVKVKALPDRLPQSFSISVESLVDFDTKLHVSDLEIPEGVTLLTDVTEVLVHVLAPRLEEAPVAAAPAEGEAAPSAAPAAAPESSGESAADAATEETAEA